jgi:hypothetical protein
MMKYTQMFSIIILNIVLCASVAFSLDIASISPTSGLSAEDTSVSIFGAGFQEGAKASLYGGGPYVKGSCSLAGLGIGKDVYVSGDYAYIAARDEGLQIIDVNNPDNPTIVGTCYIYGWALGVHVSGSYAYVANDEGGFKVIDISNPANPFIVGWCDTPDRAYKVFVCRNYAYVADGNSGLLVIDVHKPANPSIVATCPIGYAFGAIYASGDTVYVGGDTSLHLLDVSTPTSPSMLGSCEISDVVQGLHVAGDYAYVVNYAGLRVIDISDPADPNIVGYCDTPGMYTQEVYVSENHAYVADGSSGLQIIDVSYPESPFIARSWDTQQALDLYVFGNNVYLVDGSSLTVIEINVKNLSSPTIVASCNTPTGKMQVSGGYAYVTGDYDGFKVIDVSDPATPSIVGSCDTPDRAHGVFVDSGYAYVADHSSGLQVVDVSDPATPSIVGSCDTPDRAYGVFVDSGYAYVVDGNSGLLIIDVSEPTSPFILSSCDTGYTYGDVYVLGNRAFVRGSGLFYVVDVSNPAVPSILGSCSSPGFAFGISVTGSHVYIAAGISGLQVIDVSDPATPSVVGTCDPGDARDIHVSGSYVYVAADRAVRVIDISNPVSPAIVGWCDLPGKAGGVSLSGNHVYVASMGLQVVNAFVPLTGVTWINETEIRATVPAGIVPGAYKLHVTNLDREVQSIQKAFEVINSSAPPTVAFTANRTFGMRPLAVQFADQSTGGTGWYWVFGDGGTSTERYPLYTYDEVGDYSVSLTVTGPGGDDTATKPDYIHVTEPEPTIDKLKRRRREPGQRFNIVGSNFGWGNPGDYVRLGRKELPYGHIRIKEWTPTNIKVRIPKQKYVKNGCAWFQGLDERKVKVWVNIGGVDSNKKKLMLIKNPADCQ